MYVYSWIKSRIAIINLYDCATYLPLCSWQDKGETHVLYVLQHVHSEYVRIIKMDVYVTCTTLQIGPGFAFEMLHRPFSISLGTFYAYPKYNQVDYYRKSKGIKAHGTSSGNKRKIGKKKGWMDEKMTNEKWQGGTPGGASQPE